MTDACTRNSSSPSAGSCGPRARPGRTAYAPWFLGILAALLVVAVCLGAPVAAQEPGASDPASRKSEQTPKLTANPADWVSRERLGATLQMVLTMSVLSLAPALLMMTTSFVRIAVVLGLLRQALGHRPVAVQPGDHLDRAVHVAADHDSRLEGRVPGCRPAVHRSAGHDEPGGGLAGRRAADPQVHEPPDRNRRQQRRRVAVLPVLAARRPPPPARTTTCRCRSCCRRLCSAN